MFVFFWINSDLLFFILELPTLLGGLSCQPNFPLAFCQSLSSLHHPTGEIPHHTEQCPTFSGKIKVFYSAVAHCHASSDLCDVGGMH